MTAQIAIVFSSRHGHVRDIARKINDVAATRGVTAIVSDVESGPAMGDVDGAIVLGSVHFGQHAHALCAWVRRNAARLHGVPTAFVSVSGAAASIEGRKTADQYVSDFLRACQWKPDLTIEVGGAILFTKYGWLTRQMMRFASRLAGRGSDTSRDYDYTDWFAIDAFAHDFVDVLERHITTARSRKRSM